VVGNLVENLERLWSWCTENSCDEEFAAAFVELMADKSGMFEVRDL